MNGDWIEIVNIENNQWTLEVLNSDGSRWLTGDEFYNALCLMSCHPEHKIPLKGESFYQDDYRDDDNLDDDDYAGRINGRKA